MAMLLLLKHMHLIRKQFPALCGVVRFQQFLSGRKGSNFHLLCHDTQYHQAAAGRPFWRKSTPL